MHKKSILICLVLFGFAASLNCHAENRIQWLAVDHYDRPSAGERPAEWRYSECGGERGFLSDWDRYSRPEQSGLRLQIPLRGESRGYVEWGGAWMTLHGPEAMKTTLDPNGLYPAVIKPEYQPRLRGLRLFVNGVGSADPSRNRFVLRLELKGYDSTGGPAILQTQTFDAAAILQAAPGSLTMAVEPNSVGAPVGVVAWVFDRAAPGDWIEIDRVEVAVEMPVLSTTDEAALTSLGMLLANYDALSGMVNDHSKAPVGVFENVTATGKLAKLLAMAVPKGWVEESRARREIVTIADRILALPQGPVGKNRLYPHFTQKGGSEPAGVEWASGDTAYALLDLLIALQMVGDPGHRVDQVIGQLRAIDWSALQQADGAFSHGYTNDGELIPHAWKGFGAETMGVLLAARIGNPSLTGVMQGPPTDNGSGFILHCGYPILFTGVDRFGNDWTRLRREEIATQIAFYSLPGHANAFYAKNKLFGLSAAEVPDSWGYCAFGAGGRGKPVYRDQQFRDVIVGHYCGMISSLEPNAAASMYRRLKELGLVSPLTNLESLAVDAKGRLLANHLRGSWNLALQTEGWLWSDPEVANAVHEALQSIPLLNAAWRFYFPG